MLFSFNRLSSKLLLLRYYGRHRIKLLTINYPSFPFISSLKRHCLTSSPLMTGTVKIVRADEGRIVEDEVAARGAKRGEG